MRNRPARDRRVFLLAAAGLLAAARPSTLSRAQSATPRAPSAEREYAVKAAYLLAFFDYVTWPAKTNGQPLRVAIVGPDPFGSLLDRTAAERSGVRKIAFVRIDEPSDLRGFDATFITRDASDKARAALTSVHHRPVLVVADDGVSVAPAMITFVVAGNRVRFDVDLERIGSAGLHIGARLLASARRVVSRGGNGP